jgi:hypothetical protein
MTTEYHEPSSCNACGIGVNKLKVTQSDAGYVSEAETVCQSCGHTDYWAYGFFESGQDMVSNCKKYTNGGPSNASAKTENLYDRSQP